MNPERWKQIDQLLDAAFELPPEKRAAFLEEACSDDEELKKEVEVLLASDERARTFMEAPATKIAAEAFAEIGSTLAPGESVGPYRIVSPIASGGMGDVYRAHDSRIDRDVAIKLLPLHFQQNEQRLRRFEQEARAAGKLNHPNIVAIYDVGSENGTPYLVTELLQGQTLRKHLNSGQVPLRKAFDYALQIVQALSFAHERGIIHRDLKPENLFITKEGRVKLLDFGLAKLMQAEIAEANLANSPSSAGNTQAGVILGTLVYMSPEQIRGENVDHRSDIFAFGSVLYELLSNHRPFQGESQLELIHAILKSDPPSLVSANHEVSPALEKVVRRCLEKDPDHRFQSTSDLAFALEALSSTSGVVEGSSKKVKTRTSTGVFIGSAILALLTIVIVGNWNRFRNPPSPLPQSEPLKKMNIALLTTTGKISDAAISGDGKYLAYVTKDGDLQSLWVRQVAITSSVQLVPPAAIRFLGVTFSRDGNFIYYVVCPQDNPRGTAYQIPVLGGSPRRLFDDVYSGISVSRDNKSLAFIGGSGLMMSDADGHDLRNLATPTPGSSFDASPAWAPDGKSIAIVSAHPSAYQAHLIAFDLQSHRQTPITSTKWFDIQEVSWLSDGSGLILVARENASGYHHYQIWNVSYPDGRVSRITNDLDDYRGLSMTADSNAFITVRLEQTSSIWNLSNRHSDARRITNASAGLDGLWGVAWTGDDRIIYTSIASGNEDLWLMDTNGKSTKQLTMGEMAKIAPSYCGDGHYAVFMSRAAGGTHIWRIGLDGSGLKQLTNGTSEGIPTCTADGHWVVYVSPGAGNWKLWKVSVDGGQPVQLTDHPSLSPAVSPDGERIAYAFLDGQHNKNIGIISIRGGPLLQRLPLSSTVLVDVGLGLRWTSDGKSIVYVDNLGGVSNIWIQPLDGNPPKQITNFKSEEIFSYDFSPNGEIVVARGNLTRDVVMIRDFR